jgi:hypothetical protein
MFKEILKIIPRLDSAALGLMERTLGARFTRIAKRFGQGLFKAIKGGGIVGLAVGFLDKLLNPLKETQDAIERMLGQADDIVTNAEQFGTTAGKLFKLQKFAQAKGLEADSLNQLLVKFQGAVAEANADPNKKTSVRAFANDTDMAQSFFQFIQSLGKMERNQQVLVQQEVFGEKATLKMAEFLRSDFASLQKAMGAKGADAYDPKLNKLASLNDRLAEGKAGLELRDMETKSSLINRGMIDSMINSQKLDLDRENQRIKSYSNIQAISDTMGKLFLLLEQGMAQIGKFINYVTPAINKLVASVEKVANSRMIRGLFGGDGK